MQSFTIPAGTDLRVSAEQNAAITERLAAEAYERYAKFGPLRAKEAADAARQIGAIFSRSMIK